jgi:hypothetical protein
VLDSFSRHFQEDFLIKKGSIFLHDPKNLKSKINSKEQLIVLIAVRGSSKKAVSNITGTTYSNLNLVDYTFKTGG